MPLDIYFDFSECYDTITEKLNFLQIFPLV